MDLTTLIISWVAVTTVVVVLGYMRMTMGLHDILEVHLSGNEPSIDPKERTRFTRMERIDRIGIPLTVVSALIALAILFVWATEQAGPS